jgi:hypothetical protein
MSTAVTSGVTAVKGIKPQEASTHATSVAVPIINESFPFEVKCYEALFNIVIEGHLKKKLLDLSVFVEASMRAIGNSAMLSAGLQDSLRNRKDELVMLQSETKRIADVLSKTYENEEELCLMNLHATSRNPSLYRLLLLLWLWLL